MLTSPLNGPLEAGIRSLMILSAAYPRHLDVGRMVLLDYGLLHSGDLGGPESLHPPLPIRTGELGMKRRAIEDGLETMIRAGLIRMEASSSGIQFYASENAEGFIRLLTTNYASILQERASWVVLHLDELDEPSLREAMRRVFAHWSEEFEQHVGEGS